ncbi:MAG TPA: decaprenyl-phosphate phosphoribosyltransferase [Roseiflexaceae bacterium]|nr:decaprenyl-phosphate phosphoribosyltransferase [Roseiflexaceae bacterium]
MERPIEIEAVRARGGAMMTELLRAMRPKEWLKNVFVFGAIAFARDGAGQRPLWTYPDRLLVVVLAFALFCMAASAIYLINDLVDIEKDRAHPRKRTRPLASGRLSPAVAFGAAVLLLGVSLPAAFALDLLPTGTQADVDFGLALLSYVLIQGVAYSYVLKHLVILDVFTIAAGFVLRPVAGGMVLDINITEWLLICMGLLALFLGFSKRRAELVLLQGGAAEHRRILDEYSLPLIDQMTTIITAATIIAYTLFTSTAPTLPHEPFSVMMVTVPFVVYTIFRYLYLIHRHGGGGSPADLVFRDVPLAVGIALWGVTALAILAMY